MRRMRRDIGNRAGPRKEALLGDDVTREQLEAAMQERIDDGKPFRLRDLTKIARMMTNTQYVWDEGAYLGPLTSSVCSCCPQSHQATT